MNKAITVTILLLILATGMLFGCIQQSAPKVANVSGNMALSTSSTGPFARCYLIDDSNVNGMVEKVNCQVDIFFADKTVDYCIYNSPTYVINKETNLFLTTRDQCYEKLAISKRDESICNRISLANERPDCFDYIAQATKDKTICALISDAVHKASCERRILQQES